MKKVTVRQLYLIVLLPRKMAFEFLERCVKLVTQDGQFDIKDSGDFLNNIKTLEKILENVVLVTADVFGLYPSLLGGAQCSSRYTNGDFEICQFLRLYMKIIC